jgi:hypothetical protein
VQWSLQLPIRRNATTFNLRLVDLEMTNQLTVTGPSVAERQKIFRQELLTIVRISLGNKRSNSETYFCTDSKDAVKFGVCLFWRDRSRKLSAGRERVLWLNLIFGSKIKEGWKGSIRWYSKTLLMVRKPHSDLGTKDPQCPQKIEGWKWMMCHVRKWASESGESRRWITMWKTFTSAFI